MNKVWGKVRRLLLMEEHTCPWWLAYSWDHRLRRLIHDPDKILGPYVKPGDHVLDAGCGMGYFSIAMAGLIGPAGRVYALDIQQKMLEVLMRRARRRGVSALITPVLSDGEHLDVPGSVDFALAFWMLHEVDDRKRFLENLYSLLLPHGTFLLIEPRIHTPKRLFAAEVGLCRTAGFTLVATPGVGLSFAALLAK